MMVNDTFYPSFFNLLASIMTTLMCLSQLPPHSFTTASTTTMMNLKVNGWREFEHRMETRVGIINLQLVKCKGCTARKFEFRNFLINSIRSRDFPGTAKCDPHAGVWILDVTYQDFFFGPASEAPRRFNIGWLPVASGTPDFGFKSHLRAGGWYARAPCDLRKILCTPKAL